MVASAVSISLSASRMATRSSPPSSSRANSSSSSSQRRRPRSSGPLKGVVALVDVRVGADAQIDCSDVVARKLKELGASTVKRLTPKITHMVLSHLTPAWKTKIAKWQAGGGSMAAAATRYDLKIVSQLWVNACYVSKQRMAERPFFPVSQSAAELPAADQAPAPKKLKRRQSLGVDATKTLSQETDTTTAEKIAAPTTPPASKINKTAANGGRRKRRALSMEPMTSDAILKMLGTTETTAEVIDVGTPTQPIRVKNVTSSAKRRKTLSGPPKAEDVEDIIMASQATTNGSECVPESESENEKEDASVEKKNEVIEIPDSQPSPAVVKKQRASPAALTGTSSAHGSGDEFSIGTTESGKKKPTARELRRRNRNSLTYGSGLTLKTGIWSCAACGCSNPRTRKSCTDCQTPKGPAKSPTPTASPASAVATSPKTPAMPASTNSAQTTPGTTTPKTNTKARTPSPAVKEKNRRSITRATASSAAKARTSSPAASRTTRSATRIVTPSPPKKTPNPSPVKRTPNPSPAKRTPNPSPAKRTPNPSPVKRTPNPSPATRTSTTSSPLRRPRASPSLGSASAPMDEELKTPGEKKTRRKPPTAGQSSAMKRTKSATKRARPPVSGSSLTTPVVKKARRDKTKEDTVDDKHAATPGSVSLFPRKYRDVNSTPITAIPMAMSFSSTTSRKTPRKMRNVIGITGVSPETRGVLECAIHAIDANVSNESGHRKARVVKSVDYAAGVTHLIVGKETRRTMKVLFAIARGAWIVTEGWAFTSLEQERWLPEEDFELSMFANKYSRLHPESRQIFKGMKLFVGSNADPSREVLQSLIQVAGGEICNQISVADMCICADSSLFRRAQRTGVRVVTSKWVFDSIATMKLEDDAKYSFTGSSDQTPISTKKSRVAASGLEEHSTVPE